MAFYPALDLIVQVLLALPCLVVILHIYYDGGFPNLLVDLMSFIIDVWRYSSYLTFIPYISTVILL